MASLRTNKITIGSSMLQEQYLIVLSHLLSLNQLLIADHFKLHEEEGSYMVQISRNEYENIHADGPIIWPE